MSYKKCSWSLLFFLSFVYGSYSLKDVKVSVPLATKVHDSVVLRCSYDLEGEPLYTVKWYKGTMEFFRYIPKEDPNMLIFPVPGIHVDLSRSSSKEVVLIDVQPEISGRYKCEVSTDAPNFYTILVYGFMYVIDVPEEDPVMELNHDNNDNRIKAICTTPPSFPPMNVTWYINGIRINETGRRSVSLDPLLTLSKNRRAPLMTISHVEKEVDENIFQAGMIKVQCIATLFDLYKSENVRYIEDRRPQPWLSSDIGTTLNVAGCQTSSIWVLILLLFIGLSFV